MADSDEEFDSRRREKFRRERNDYQTEAPPVRVTRPQRREEWGADRGDWNRPGGGPPPRRDYREYPPKNFERPRAFSPGGRPLDGSPVSPQPPPKRPRADWSERPGYGGYEGNYGGFGGGRPPYGGPDPGAYAPFDSYARGLSSGMPGVMQLPPPVPIEVDYQTQPPMMSFKGFLATQSDDISDEEAIRKYSEYKLSYRRQQINDFFLAHMDEEWFKMKYHPDDSVKRKEEQMNAVKERLKVFNELLEKRFFTNLTVDADMAEGLVRLLDTVVIKLEGGNDNDLRILDQGPPPDIMVGPKRELDKKEAEQEELQRKARALLENTAPVDDGPPAPEKKGDGEASEESDNEDEDLVPPGMENRKKEEEKDEEEEAEEKKDEETEAKKPVANDGPEDIDSGDELDKPAEDGPKEEPRPLHKTASIFLRSIHPAVSKTEVEKLCARYPGFLRCAIADPAPERRWFRRGWATFQRNTNVKEICWNLRNIRLKDAELGAILNRDLARRIRTVSGITCHKTVVRNDIRIAAKVVINLDRKAGLWSEPENGEAEKTAVPYTDLSKNPVMKNITEYLIEEASAEEDELVGPGEGEGAAAQGCDLERDEELIAVLDRLILYLRIVHSVDFYNHSEYPNEDEMPNRCGILHTRGIPPSTKLTQKELTDYMKSFETKMTAYMEPAPLLSIEEAKTLGLRDPEEEVGKFIQANTQELAKDKYLCPLSGKKFRGPDFVRKHILNKHADRLEDVRKEVIFYDNYIRDPKRPHLPVHPGNAPGGGAASATPVAGNPAASLLTSNPAVAALASAAAQNPAVMAAVAAVASNALKGGAPVMPPDLMQRLGLSTGAPGMSGGRDQNGMRGRDRGSPRSRGGLRGRGRNDPRSVVGYHDLDAPEDVEMF